MKRIILIISSMGICSLLWADIITVSNNPDSPGMYTNLQTAIDDAMDGDTILIAGSPTSYGTVTIDKKLRLVGTGIAPDYRQNTLFTILQGLRFLANIDNTGASGSQIEGISFLCSNCLSIASAGGAIVSDVTVKRNLFVRTGASIHNVQLSKFEDWIIINNTFRGIEIDIQSNVQNITIGNNIFSNGSYYISNGDNLTSTNIIVSNNIFFGNDTFGSNTNIYRGNTYNIVFVNNILYRISPDLYGETVENCVFNNNISYDATSNIFSVTGLNSGAGNFENVDPQFVSIPNGATLFTFTDDLHLMPGSPGENAGTDGTYIGIYGGTYPFPIGVLYDAGPAPAIPEITEMNILNSALKKTDQLQIQIKANSNN